MAVDIPDVTVSIVRGVVTWGATVLENAGGGGAAAEVVVG